MIAQATTFDAALGEHLAALQRRDIEAFAATLSREQCSTVAPDGTIADGYEAVRAAHAGWFGAPDSWTFEPDVAWSRSGDDLGVALLRVTYRERPDATPARFLLSVVFAREADGWRFIYDQNTPLQGD